MSGYDCRNKCIFSFWRNVVDWTSAGIDCSRVMGQQQQNRRRVFYFPANKIISVLINLVSELVNLICFLYLGYWMFRWLENGPVQTSRERPPVSCGGYTPVILYSFWLLHILFLLLWIVAMKEVKPRCWYRWSPSSLGYSPLSVRLARSSMNSTQSTLVLSLTYTRLTGRSWKYARGGVTTTHNSAPQNAAIPQTGRNEILISGAD